MIVSAAHASPRRAQLTNRISQPVAACQRQSPAAAAAAANLSG